MIAATSCLLFHFVRLLAPVLCGSSSVASCASLPCFLSVIPWTHVRLYDRGCLIRASSTAACGEVGASDLVVEESRASPAEDDVLLALRRRLRERHGSEFPLREHFIKGTGPGGQKVNKSSSCVQLIQFSPALGTNVVVKCHIHRSLLRNRIEATRILLHKLDEACAQQSRAAKQLREKAKRRILKLSDAAKARNKFEKQLRSDKKATRRESRRRDEWF